MGRRCSAVVLPFCEDSAHGVVRNEIPVSFGSLEFHREPTRVTENPSLGARSYALEETYRTVSGEPVSPPTVENRTVTGQLTPSRNMSARQRSSRLSVHSHTPCAPEPLAWTTRSGMLSIFSYRNKVQKMDVPLAIEMREQIDEVEVL